MSSNIESAGVVQKRPKVRSAGVIQRKAKPRLTSESFGKDIVLVQVGPDKINFHLHKAIICNVAPYFKAVFEGNFKEGQEKCLNLPTEDAEMFKYFQLWVYTGEVCGLQESAKDIAWKVLTDLYLFAEARGIPELQNIVLDTYIDKDHSGKQIPPIELRRIYENSSAEALVRKLLVDLFCSKIDYETEMKFDEASKEQIPKLFLIDVVITQSKVMGTPNGMNKIDFRDRRSNYYVKDRTAVCS